MNNQLYPIGRNPEEYRRASSVSKGIHFIFVLLIVYYWALEYVTTLDDEVKSGSVLYFLYVSPIAVFALTMISNIRLSRQINVASLWIIVYVMIVCIVSIVRSDIQTILSTALFGSAVAAILIHRLSPSTNLLNGLFLASIVASSLAFLLGRSLYTILPGYSLDELWIRVSLFPHVSTSGFFAGIVLFVNILRPGGKLRRTCIILAIYFLALSGIRSALIACLIGALYFVLVHNGRLKKTSTKMIFLIISMLFFIGSLFATPLLLLILNSGNEALNIFLFRTDGGGADQGDVVNTIYRTWLWFEHIRIASDNPIFGVGTFDFSAIADFDPIGSKGGTGSESFLTGLYARVGLCSLLLIAGFTSAIRSGARANDHMKLVVGIFVFVAMIAYGSFVSAYSFIFLIMVGLLAGSSIREEQFWNTSFHN